MTNKKLKFGQIATLTLNCAIRLTLPLYIFINPITGSLIALFTDLIDHELLVRWQKIPRQIYQLQDKYLDQFWYLLIIIYLFTSQAPLLIVTLITILFVYRILGQVLFIKYKEEKYFLLFPNLAEPFFWLWIAYPKSFSNTSSLLTWSLIILVLKLYQEYFIHISKSSLLNNLLKLRTKR